MAENLSNWKDQRLKELMEENRKLRNELKSPSELTTLSMKFPELPYLKMLMDLAQKEVQNLPHPTYDEGVSDDDEIALEEQSTPKKIKIEVCNESLNWNQPGKPSIGSETPAALTSGGVRAKAKPGRKSNSLGALNSFEVCLVTQFRLIGEKTLPKYVRRTLETTLIEMLQEEFKKLENEENDN